MSHINLLPWREQYKKRQKQQFFVVLALSAAVVLALSYVSMLYVNTLIEAQQQRNQYLQTQTIILDRRISEIRNIKKEKAELQRRIDLIQTLEKKRNGATRLFNTLAEQVPTGIYLDHVTFADQKINVTGKSESHNRVSKMLRNIDGSGWLGDAYLSSIVAGSNTKVKLYNFSMRFVVLPEKRDK